MWVKCRRGIGARWDLGFLLQRLLGPGGARRHGAYGGVSRWYLPNESYQPGLHHVDAQDFWIWAGGRLPSHLLIQQRLLDHCQGARHLPPRLLGTLISPLQSTFVPGRQMSDNVVVAKEIISDWRRSSTAGFIWKVDFAKAYDSLDLRFLWNVLKRCGFPEAWIK